MKPIDAMMATVEWEEIVREESTGADDIPFATHKGILHIGPAELIVYQLNDGRRVIDSESMEKFFFGMGM